MPELPVPPVTDAIAKLLSNVLPPRTYEYLFALVPGLFFEASLLVANPEFVSKQIAGAEKHFASGYYSKLALALMFAFVVGYGFMLLVLFVRRLLGFLQRLSSFMWAQFCRGLLLVAPVLLKKLNWTQRPAAVYFVRYLQDQYVGIPWWAESLSDDAERRCWARLARQLLWDRYGVKHDQLTQNEWNVLYVTLGTIASTEVLGSISLVASEASGWSGLAAAGLAPELWNTNYLSFCAFLILTGLLNDFKIVERLNDARYLGFLRIRALMTEYGKPVPTVDHRNSNEEPAAGEVEE